MQIGSHTLPNRLILAPMAGVTDRPFRQLCRRLGAGLAVSEMMSCNPQLMNTEKTQRRADHAGETGLRVVQIAGADPAWMAESARFNVARGAQVIDINMGCPAKKVCNKYAGSALMGDLAQAAAIIRATVDAVDVPVTLKMRLGVSPDRENALELAQIAEQAGIAAVTIHGRTRDQRYTGDARYEHIAAIKAALKIPVIANGDIDSPQKARAVFAATAADAVMIGRAAQGNPWIFREVAHFLATGRELPPPETAEVTGVLLDHVRQLHQFYGAIPGARIARKHVGWYLEAHASEHPASGNFRDVFNAIEDADAQLRALDRFFSHYSVQAA